MPISIVKERNVAKRKQTKKDIALVFGITKDYVFALANTLIGLKKHNKTFWDDIIVYHNGITELEQKCINKILPVKFTDLSKEEHFVEIAKSNVDVIDKYSVAAFYRYECLKLLDNYSQVIWNDVDILIQSDISELVNYGKQSGLAFSLALPNFVVGSSLKKIIKKYKMFAPLWNDGIMIVTDKLSKYHEMYDWCINATREYKDFLLWPDLAIFNLMIQEFDIIPENISREKYVCLPTSDNAGKASIVHAYGDKKFWNNLPYMKKFPEWVKNAIKWSKTLHKEKSISSLPLISCIMSCYERYDYLLEAVDSILAQSYANFEIIVVLEKSSEQSDIEKVLKSLKDDRIKIIKNTKKLGFPASLNVGIDAAKGMYIARMDDDDISLPCRFATQVKFMEKNNDIGIVGSAMVVFGQENSFAPVFCDSEYLKASTLVESPFKHPTVMMRKNLLDKYKLRYDPDYFTEDYELWSRAVYDFPTANIPEALVCYRAHNQQATSSGTNSNEQKIHTSHKKVMAKQIEKYLGLRLTDNELELLQTRKGYNDAIPDKNGIARLKKKAVEKIIEANRKSGVYDNEILAYILGKRDNGVFETINPHNTENPSSNELAVSSYKKILKSAVMPIVKPFYARLVDRMEKKMIEHDRAVQSNLQQQIDQLKTLR